MQQPNPNIHPTSPLITTISKEYEKNQGLQYFSSARPNLSCWQPFHGFPSPPLFTKGTAQAILQKYGQNRDNLATKKSKVYICKNLNEIALQ